MKFKGIIGLLCLLCSCEVKQEDYSEYGFTDVSWTRTTESDTEFLSLWSDGSFSYYCACGNSVNDSDLCETYSYDDETKTIKLNCYATTKDMVKKIKIISVDENRFELQFEDEIRVFEREK